MVFGEMVDLNRLQVWPLNTNAKKKYGLSQLKKPERGLWHNSILYFNATM